MDRKLFWDSKPWQAFKTFAILFSFTVNLVLIIVLLLVAPLIIPIVSDIANPIVGGLSDSFVQMNNASIVQTITVDDDLPISFTLPLSTTTNVLVTEDVGLRAIPATFQLPGGGGAINGFVTLNLPKGLDLPVQLNLEVPVDQTIPVVLKVPVEIPLNQTELGPPFTTLQDLFIPLDRLLRQLPASNEELYQRISGDAPTPIPDATETGDAAP